MLNKVNQPQLARQVAREIPLYHRYTPGVAGDRFFKALRDQRQILVSPCLRCGRRLLPPKMYCERCFEPTSDQWEALTGAGYLRSFTVLHRSLDEEPLDPPEIVVLVCWDRAHGGLLHRLQDVEPSLVRVGMAVEPVWADQRTGAMSDISHFRPAQPG